MMPQDSQQRRNVVLLRKKEQDRMNNKKEVNVRREGKRGKIEAREKVQGRKE